jgi:penicillin-binding protein 2
VVIEGMADVVTGGTAKASKIDSIDFCGKTGTAQNPHGKNHSVFIAFAPRQNAKIAISVVVENAGFGAAWAAPIASLMLEKYLSRNVKRKEMEDRIINADIIHGTNLKYGSTEGHFLPD